MRSANQLLLGLVLSAATGGCAASSGAGTAAVTTPDSANQLAADTQMAVDQNGPLDTADTAVVDATDAAQITELPPADAPSDAAAEVAVADVAKPKPNTTGQYKEDGLWPPDFTQAKNSDGTAVSKADLVGHWTVMWFYPAALTSG